MHLRLSLQFFPHFFLKGVGTVISGTCLKGTIRLNDVLLLGPDSLGQFASVSIKGIHRKRMPVREVRGGQTCSFALKKARMFEGFFFSQHFRENWINNFWHLLFTVQIKRNQIRKGMFLVDERLKPTACWEFEGEILVLHHPTTISPKYQAMGELMYCSCLHWQVTFTLFVNVSTLTLYYFI